MGNMRKWDNTTFDNTVNNFQSLYVCIQDIQ